VAAVHALSTSESRRRSPEGRELAQRAHAEVRRALAPPPTGSTPTSAVRSRACWSGCWA